MNKYSDRKSEIMDRLKAYIEAASLESVKIINNDIKASAHDNIENAIISICNHQLLCKGTTVEMKRYLIGKIYRIEMVINKNIRRPQSTSLSDYIMEVVSVRYGISPALVSKYSTFSKAIDRCINKKALSTAKILRGSLKIPYDYISKLSNMSDFDIEYLQSLFHEDFYKLAGYILIKDGKFDLNCPAYEKPHATTALIKQMPKHDPDAMITSLSLTASSWINSIQKTVSLSDISQISEDAKVNLYVQLSELKDEIEKTLIILEEKYDG